jgi:glycosyltransferase involved in cell wall biosynthesis
MGPRLIYVANARTPTEKAHGWQIAKMCEAFAACGANVELWTPRRRQEDERAARLDLFDYYGVARSFEHRTVPNIDVVAMEPSLPPAIANPLIQAHSFIWGGLAAMLASREHPDLLYTRDMGTTACASLVGIPSAYEAHELPGRSGARLFRRMSARREPRLLVALTPYVEEAHRDLGFGERRTIVEGDAVDPTQYQNLPNQGDARSRLGLPATRRLVGFVGRFDTYNEEKGIPELIEAFARIDDTNTMIVCIGGPMDRVPRYAGLAAQRGLARERLLFLNKVPSQEVPLWLRALDVGIIPSPDRPHFALAASPLKLFEYAAAGLPIIATDLPSMRLVLRNEESALLVPPGNAAALAVAITRVLSDPELAHRLASVARADVAGRTWTARAERILRASEPEP